MEISRPVRFSISNARNFLQHNQPAEAIANYLAVLKTMPVDTRKRYVTEMMTTLSIYLKSESESYRALEVLNNVSGLYEFEFSMWKIYAEWMFNRGMHLHFSCPCGNNNLFGVISCLSEQTLFFAIATITSLLRYPRYFKVILLIHWKCSRGPWRLRALMLTGCTR